MSETSACPVFTPQTWRPTRCSVCFGERAQHSSVALEAEPQPESKPQVVRTGRKWQPPARAAIVERKGLVPQKSMPTSTASPASPAAESPEEDASMDLAEALPVAGMAGIAQEQEDTADLEVPEPPALEDQGIEEATVGIPEAPPMELSQPEDAAIAIPDAPPLGAGEAKPSSAPASGRAALLTGIRGGVALRHVTTVTQSPAVAATADFGTQLHWQLSKLKRQQQEEQKCVQLSPADQDRLQALARRITRFGSTDPVSFAEARNLLSDAKVLEEELKLPEGFLATHPEWPQDKLDSIASSYRLVERLSNAIDQAERFAGDSGSNWVVLDGTIIERFIVTLITAFREAPVRVEEGAAVFRINCEPFSERMTVAATLIDQLLAKSLSAYKSVLQSSTLKFDKSAKAVKAYQMLSLCCKLARDIEIYRLCELSAQQQVRLAEARALRAELEKQHKAVAVAERKGTWDTAEKITLRHYEPTDTQRARQQGSTAAFTQVSKLLAALRENREQPAVLEELKRFADEHKTSGEQLASLARGAIASHNLEALQVLVGEEEFDTTADSRAEWLHEAVSRNFVQGVLFLLEERQFDVNARTASGGHTPLHIASRTGNLSMVALLLRKGGNPLLVNALNRTPLQQLAIARFPAPALPKSQGEEDGMLHSMTSFAPYLFSERLSDVALKLDNGDAIPAHRVILCAQSPMFKSMLDSESKLWADSDSREVLMPEIPAATMRLLLTYLYTGTCKFVRDDVELGVSVMTSAARFLLEPLREYCQRILATCVNADNVVALYRVAVLCGASTLMNACAHYIMSHYEKVADPSHEALLELLDTHEQVQTAAPVAPARAVPAALATPSHISVGGLDD